MEWTEPRFRRRIRATVKGTDGLTS
jgi:hypothetical protein